MNSRIRVKNVLPLQVTSRGFSGRRAEQASELLALAADVAEAHRQVPIDRRDWHLLGSQVPPRRDNIRQCCRHLRGGLSILLLVKNRISFGPVSHTISRATQRSLGTYWWRTISTSTREEVVIVKPLLSFFILCALSGVPLSWSKTARGDTVAWVGFEILHRSYSLGISARRAEWFVIWTRDMASRPVVNMDNFEEGLGRIMYVAGGFRIRETVSSPAVQIPQCPPTRFHQKVTFLCCVHSKTPVDSG